MQQFESSLSAVIKGVDLNQSTGTAGLTQKVLEQWAPCLLGQSVSSKRQEQSMTFTTVCMLDALLVEHLLPVLAPRQLVLAASHLAPSQLL